MSESTIAAISTGLTSSGIGIIRICGDDSFSIINKIFKTKSNKDMNDSESFKAHYGHIVDNGEIIDEVIVLIMKAPHTYTREDTVEINCHGGIAVMKRVLEVVFKNGAIPAEPGEFTKRAFLNGRIDLSQAEAVMDLINSKNEYAIKNSISHLNGNLYKEIEELRKMIIYHTALIESALDDPEHYSLENYGENLLIDVDNIVNRVDKMLKTFDNGRIISEGIRTVIVGKPNVGKSTLLNNILGIEKAIVTNIPGTTRDILEENVNIDGISLNFVDTAGIRNTDDIVEKIGVERSIDNIDNADLVLFVIDSSVPLDENDKKIISLLENRNVIVLLNKTDLETVANIDLLKESFSNVLSISAKENIGMDEFRDTIKNMFFSGLVSYNDEIMITNERHKYLLDSALESLYLVRDSIIQGMPEDFFSIDLINAYTSLGKIIGEALEEDLVNEIFDKFCMGK